MKTTSDENERIERGEGGELDTRGGGSVEQNALGRGGSVNIEPQICNGHLPEPWG